MKISLHIEAEDASELAPLFLALADPEHVADLIAAHLGTPVVETPPIISPAEEQLPQALSLLAGEIADLRDSERALKTELYRLLQDNPSAIYDANYSASIPSSETPEEEPTHERDDEPLRVPVHEVRPPVRPDPSNDAIDDQRSSEHLLQLAGDDRSSQQQEPVAEADVRPTPTMTPEQERQWMNEQIAPPPRRGRPPGSGRKATGGQLLNKAREHLTKEAENTALLDTPIELSEEPKTPEISLPDAYYPHQNEITPEEAAHEDAAIILAPDPLPERETPSSPTLTVLPDCTCPEGWWDVPRGVGSARIPSSKHDGACGLHRHRFKLPSASDDGEGGKYLGRCECGETKLHEPFSAQDNRAAAAKEQQVKAGQVGAAARTANRHTAAVSA